MSEWRAVDDSVILDTPVLALWLKSGHVEDVTFYYYDGLCYTLFDGEVLNDFPTHWMPLPEAPHA